MGQIPYIRSLSKGVSVICFTTTILFLFFALASINFLPATALFLFLAAISVLGGVYFLEQHKPLEYSTDPRI